MDDLDDPGAEPPPPSPWRDALPWIVGGLVLGLVAAIVVGRGWVMFWVWAIVMLGYAVVVRRFGRR